MSAGGAAAWGAGISRGKKITEHFCTAPGLQYRCPSHLRVFSPPHLPSGGEETPARALSCASPISLLLQLFLEKYGYFGEPGAGTHSPAEFTEAVRYEPFI